MTNIQQVGIKDGANLDAFSRLRVSNPTNLWSTSGQYTPVAVQMENGNTGTGQAVAYDANTRLTALTCNAGTGTCFVQSWEYVPYQP
jgi:hypothetical protein